MNEIYNRDGLTVYRDPHLRATTMVMADEFLHRGGFQVKASPAFVLPAFACDAFLKAGEHAYRDGKSSHIWAAECKRKLMLKKFPFLRFVK